MKATIALGGSIKVFDDGDCLATFSNHAAFLKVTRMGLGEFNQYHNPKTFRIYMKEHYGEWYVLRGSHRRSARTGKVSAGMKARGYTTALTQTGFNMALQTFGNAVATLELLTVD